MPRKSTNDVGTLWHVEGGARGQAPKCFRVLLSGTIPAKGDVLGICQRWLSNQQDYYPKSLVLSGWLAIVRGLTDVYLI